MAKRQSSASDATSIRLPVGWKERVLAAYASQLNLPLDSEHVTFTGAVVFALGRQFAMKYSQEANVGGRPAKTYQVTVATRQTREVVEAVFDDFSQPWAAAILDDVHTSAVIPMTVVTLSADGFEESSTMPGRTIGLRLAREIAAAIDAAGREAS